MQSNEVLATMKGHKQKILTSTFSPDGKLLYSTSNDSTVKVWDVANGKLLKSFGTFPASTASITVSPNGRILAMTTMPANRVIYLLDAETGKILQVLRGGVAASLGEVGFGKQVQNILVTRKDLMSFVDADTEPAPELFHRWDFSSLAESASHFLKKLQKSETSLYRTLNDTMIACEYNDSLVCFWNVENGKEVQRIRATSGNILCTAISQDKKLGIIVSGKDKKRVIRAYNLTTGALQWVDSSFFMVLRRGLNSFVFSPNDSIIFALQFDRTRNAADYVLGFDRTTGKILHNFPARMPYFLDSCRFSWENSKDTVFNVQTSKKEIYKFDFAQGMEVLRADNDVVIAKNQRGDSVAFHIPTKQKLTSKNGYFTISRNGKYAFNTENASTQIIEVSTGKQMCSLFSFDAVNWAVTTPDGRFDGSEGGLRYLHFAVGNEPIELEQLKERYYEPGLLSKLMGYNKEPLRDIERFDSVKLYPRVELERGTKQVPKPDSKPNAKFKTSSNKASVRGVDVPAPNAASSLTFTVKLQNQGGGIGRVPVWLNGKELTDDARQKNTPPNAAEQVILLNLDGNRLLLPGTTNTLTVRAFNAENAVQSRAVNIEFQAPGERLQSAPHLYAVIAGTSDYQGDELDLPFASNDAEQIAKAVQIASERLLGADRVHITLLTAKVDSTQSKTRTTKTNIVNALKAVQQRATANDILFVYLTGHGMNWGGQDGDWYYLTCDARQGDDEKFTDAALRTSVALSSHELTDLMRAIPARKQTLALDACASGKAVENLLASRDVPTSQLRAMMRMKDRAGLHVISGCASNAVSYEASRYGQGLLTYSLLMGMKGGALRDAQFVDIKQLFEFAADRVPELARDIGRVQKPQVCSPFGGSSFDIGLVTEAEAKAIPLADAKPLFVRANFQDEKKMYDQLNLAKMVNESLRGVTYRAAVNPFEAWLVYLDVPEFPSSYSLNGRYVVKGEEVSVTAVIRRGEEEGTVFTVKGSVANMKELAKEVVNETRKRMK
jgi:VCBS repeat-containing protein